MLEIESVNGTEREREREEKEERDREREGACVCVCEGEREISFNPLMHLPKPQKQVGPKQ